MDRSPSRQHRPNRWSPRNVIVARYALEATARYSTVRVARPTATGKTPVAAGSRVPAWPTRRSSTIRRTRGHHVMTGPARRLVDHDIAVPNCLASVFAHQAGARIRRCRCYDAISATRWTNCSRSASPPTIVQPAARGCPPPPNSAAIAATSTSGNMLRMLTRQPVSLE